MEIFESNILQEAQKYNSALAVERERAIKHLISYAYETLEQVKDFDFERTKDIKPKHLKKLEKFLNWLIKKERTAKDYRKIMKKYQELPIELKLYFEFDSEIDAVNEVFLYYYPVDII
ncbi:MAG: hypothetical protein Q4D02_04230 [Clostridia bacterium]|nr:hypothetical protein [Clostridia bacterium]